MHAESAKQWYDYDKRYLYYADKRGNSHERKQRNIKKKGMLSSLLDVVPGIGEVRKKELLKHFGSLKKLKEASEEELAEVVSKEVAKNLVSYLKEL